jgi:hypothetical protein
MGVSVVVVVVVVSLSSWGTVCVLDSGGGVLGIFVVVVVVVDEVDVGGGGWLCVVVDIFESDDGTLWFVFSCSCSFSSFLPFLFPKMEDGNLMMSDLLLPTYMGCLDTISWQIRRITQIDMSGIGEEDETRWNCLSIRVCHNWLFRFLAGLAWILKIVVEKESATTIGAGPRHVYVSFFR